MAHPSAKDKWFARLGDALRDGTFVKLTLSVPRGHGASLKNVFVRPIELEAGERLSFVYRQGTRDITKNFTHEEGLELLGDLVGSDFCCGHLFTTRWISELEFREGRVPRLIEGPPAHTAPAPKTHDQPRRHLINPEGSCWLHELGVTTADGKVAKGMEAKFRQISKFVEVLDHLISGAGFRPAGNGPASRRSRNAPTTPGLPGQKRRESLLPLSLVDMGCGKGYLTFAAYEFLNRSDWFEASVRGVEARPELVELCNRVARECGFERLQFEAGDIGTAALDRIDVLIALHACDTATDDAIAKGISAGARLIIVSPCCHKELRPQLRPPLVLAGAFKHGILRERQAEFVTDALRAALLEYAGYDTKVFEFISTEHTSKNLMIAAVKRPRPIHGAAHQQSVRDLAAFYGIRSQRLAGHLRLELASDGNETGPGIHASKL